jgi:hypothetical protein
MTATDDVKDMPSSSSSSKDVAATERVQQKSVSFAPFAEVYTIESHPRFLHDDLWYSSYEYQSIKRRNAHDIQEAQLSHVNILFRPHHYRGLERTLDDNRKVNLFRSIQAVLMEQDRQQVVQQEEEQQPDTRAIADLYQAYCVSSVEKALRMAKMDEQDAQLAMVKPWNEGEDDREDSVRSSVSSSWSDASDISNSDSLRVFQQQARCIENFASREQKASPEEEEAAAAARDAKRLWRNLLAPMIPTWG